MQLQAKSFFLIVYFCLFGLSPSAKSDITLKPEKINASFGIANWKTALDLQGREQIKSDRVDPVGLTECRETEELSGVILCLSFFQQDMNRIFGRMSIFSEGGYVVPKGTLVSFGNHDLINLNKITQGNDLTSSKIMEFYNALKQHCQSPECKLSLTEQRFFKNVISPLKKRYSDFIILGFSHQSFDSYQINVGHEMMHAQYFTVKAYRDTIEVFWQNKVSEDQKKKIRNALAEEGYDPNDELLMKNEFQAFILEPGAETSRLKDFVPIYRKLLLDDLLRNSVLPIQIH